MTNVSSFDHHRPSYTQPTTSEINNSNNNILHEVTVIPKSTISTINHGFLESQTLSFPRRPRSGQRIPAIGIKKGYMFGNGEDGYCKETMMVKDEDESQMKEVKIKYERIDENKIELEGLNVISVNSEEVDLNFLARVSDGAYGEELASMTEGMSRSHLIGFMEGLEGHWCGRSERRKVVDAAEFVKALPIDWKIELALRHRAGLASVYCRSYVSPSGEHFKSCKDAAIYLKNQFLTDVASPFEEGKRRQINNGCHALPKSEANKVAESDDDVAVTGKLYDVKVSTLIECSPCGIIFQDMRRLEKHLATFHKETTRRFHLPTGTRVFKKHADMDLDDELKPHQNGKGSSSSRKSPESQEPIPIINERFKTNCTWCNKEFLCEPVDTETMEDASGFMCSQCKDKLCGSFERSLAKTYKY